MQEDFWRNPNKNGLIVYSIVLIGILIAIWSKWTPMLVVITVMILLVINSQFSAILNTFTRPEISKPTKTLFWLLRVFEIVIGLCCLYLQFVSWDLTFGIKPEMLPIMLFLIYATLLTFFWYSLNKNLSEIKDKTYSIKIKLF